MRPEFVLFVSAALVAQVPLAAASRRRAWRLIGCLRRTRGAIYIYKRASHLRLSADKALYSKGVQPARRGGLLTQRSALEHDVMSSITDLGGRIPMGAECRKTLLFDQLGAR